MRKWLVVPLVIAALTVLGSSGTANEDPSAPRDHEPIGGLAFVDEVEVTIANLIVYVTDRKGEAVTDLTKDDFEVEQNGVPKPISNFQLYTEDVVRQRFAASPEAPVPQPTPAPTGKAAGGPLPVHLVIYIDNQNLKPLDRNRVLAQARGFIQANLHPPAQMMVVAYQRSFEVLQPFTSDPSEVLAALRRVRRYTGGRGERESAKRDVIELINEMGEGWNTGQGGSSQWNRAYGMVDNYARETANDLQFTLDNLRRIVTSLSGLPGKKGILYLSNGLPMIPGQDLYYQLSEASRNSTVMLEMMEHDFTRRFKQLADAAASQDVTFYPIDASGLNMGNVSSAEYATAQDGVSSSINRSNLTDSLRLLADATGGIAIVNTNDVGPRLELVAQDMYTYYSIGYPLQASGKDKVHKVKVALRDDPAFKGYQLRYRSRFVEKSIETRVQDRVVSGLVFEIDDNPIGLDVEVGTPAAASEQRWLVPARVSFPIDHVALLPVGNDYVGRVVMFVAVRDDDGRRSDLVRQEHEVRVPAEDYERAQRQRWTIDSQLLMESGRYRLAIGMLDPITRQDSYVTIRTAVNPD